MVRSLLSYLMGSSDAKLIGAKKEIAYLFEKINNPKIANKLEQYVSKAYEDSCNTAFRHCGQVARSHANLKSSDQLMNNDYIDRFIQIYGFGLFVNAVSVGYELSAGTFTPKLENELGIVMGDLNSQLMQDATQSYGSVKIAECFSSTGKVLADLGVEVGTDIYNKGYKF